MTLMWRAVTETGKAPTRKSVRCPKCLTASILDSECDKQRVAVKMPSRPWTDDELKRSRRAGTTKRRLEGADYNAGHNVRSIRLPDGLLAKLDTLAAAARASALERIILWRSAARLLDPARQDWTVITRPASLAALVLPQEFRRLREVHLLSGALHPTRAGNKAIGWPLY
jgi:hypothetical protein